jgi:CubicO group peptidase (beta-lactamase class C family)
MKKITGFVILIVLVCLCSVTGAFAQDPFEAKEFKAFVDREMKAWKVPGAAVLIVREGKIIFSEGFGYRDIQNKKPVTPKTLFGIGSCSKAFTAMLLAMLADEKKVDFDRPVREYYPLLKLYDPYVTEHLTIKDILSHRSGIPRYDMAMDSRDTNREKAITRLKYLKPNAGFRERFQYNNFHYALAGGIIDQVSGLLWEKAVMERIFKPLEMSSSNTTPNDSKKFPDHALPYKLDLKALKQFPETREDLLHVPLKEIPFTDIGVYGPAGSINSNLEDMANWVIFLLNEGRGKAGQLVSKKNLIQSLAPQMVIGTPVKYEEILPSSYGLAWGITPYRGQYLVNHGGMIDGFTAQVGLFPFKKIGLVILTNRSNNDEFTLSVAYGAYDRLLGLSRIPWSQRFSQEIPQALAGLKKKEADEEKTRKKDTQPSRPLSAYAGKYDHPGFWPVNIELKDNQLYFLVSGQEEIRRPLRHYHYDTFKTWDEDKVGGIHIKITFLLNDQGDVDKLSIPLQAEAEDIVFKK